MHPRLTSSLLCLFASVVFPLANAVAHVEAPARQQIRFIATEDPVLPARLSKLGIATGTATFAIVVDRTGALIDFLLLEATDSAMGESVVAVLPKWTFYPAQVGGQSINAMGRIVVNFSASGAVTTLLGEEIPNSLFLTAKARDEDRNHYAIASLRDLDQLPTPLEIVEPVLRNPEILAGKDLQLVFRFFIDENGRVRIPVAETSPGQTVDTEIINAVHRALSQWRFSPPLIKGKPVVTHAMQPFRFAAPAVGQTTESAAAP